ncbi:GNAT family N-acetyltransferase [Sinirhodobacter populi]|uniref:GNAT family N-acetyltransferase n=1 Tax=Paenirhodobacter populi TaxID=2306993 RepID=A0A443KG72_9RHOB|nr:GNAT family N-acetyltransferase [Sinirhodobacter populi]RWR31759.1 GNAT family N-acetyltransferase [Sinirhodobacter populi]
MTLDALAALHARCFTTPRPWSAAEFADLLASRFCFLLTAPEGFLLGRVIAGEAELLTLAVDPDARRRGAGRRLMADFLRGAADRAADSAFLEVAEDNLPARALYAATGWQPAGRRRAYYRTAGGNHVDALVLRHALAPPGN